MHVKIYIRKLVYPWRYLRVNIPARIGLSPPVVKFGPVWHGLNDFVETVPKCDRKNLENGDTDSFLIQVQLYHSIHRILLDSLTKMEADHNTSPTRLQYITKRKCTLYVHSCVCTKSQQLCILNLVPAHTYVCTLLYNVYMYGTRPAATRRRFNGCCCRGSGDLPEDVGGCTLKSLDAL